MIILKIFRHRKGQVLHMIRVLSQLKELEKTNSLLIVSVASNMVVLCTTKILVHGLIVVNMTILFEIAH